MNKVIVIVAAIMICGMASAQFAGRLCSGPGKAAGEIANK
jgi:hypothetical protein